MNFRDQCINRYVEDITEYTENEKHPAPVILRGHGVGAISGGYVVAMTVLSSNLSLLVERVISLFK